MQVRLKICASARQSPPQNLHLSLPKRCACHKMCARPCESPVPATKSASRPRESAAPATQSKPREAFALPLHAGRAPNLRRSAEVETKAADIDAGPRNLRVPTTVGRAPSPRAPHPRRARAKRSPTRRLRMFSRTRSYFLHLICAQNYLLELSCRARYLFHLSTQANFPKVSVPRKFLL